MSATFLPDYASPPGETLAATLQSLGMSQTELARRMGRPIKTINEIIQAKTAVTADTALELERVLGIDASLLCGLEANYREHLARKRATDALAVDEEWLKEIPIKEMQKRDWIPEQKDQVKLMEVVLRFFGVAGTEEWKSVWEEPIVAYRKSPAFSSKAGSLAAWIRRGEAEGRKQDGQCAPFDATRFREALNKLRAVTLLEPKEWVAAITLACNACGVAYAFIPELPGCHVSGATRWLRDDCALILQSGRYKDDGHFWFTFFHEARHVLQGRQKKTWIIETDERSADPQELDADTFAAEHLVPAKLISATRRKYGGKLPVKAVEELASELGIAPGIVAGHLQHEKIWLPVVAAKLKKKFNVDQVRGVIF